MDQPREQFVNIIRETYTSGNTRGLWKISIEKKRNILSPFYITWKILNSKNEDGN